MYKVDIIFEITDKTGRKIRLSKERWQHISSKHSELSSIQKLEDIKNTLINPTIIVKHKFDEAKRNYYKYYKDKQRYLTVVVKYLNGEGYISTAFTSRKIIKR